MTASSIGLAIIVPAYRARYLREALNSIADQSAQQFQVYVFDDASSDDLLGSFNASRLCGRANAKFSRFEQNMGGASLAGHWNRCVQATGGEPWIWLFSDDDVADPRCVELFTSALQSGRVPGNVCRFNTATIDCGGDVTEIHPPHPAAESAIEFAYHRLSFHRRSFAPEYLFRRSAFLDNGGFVCFPFALGSDDASWISFAGQLPIVTIPGAMVYWRSTGENTSLLKGPAAIPKLLALADFCVWIQDRFRGESPLAGDLFPPSKIDMEALARQWFRGIMSSLPGETSILRIPALAGMLRDKGLGNWRGLMGRLMAILLVPKVMTPARWIKRLVEGKRR